MRDYQQVNEERYEKDNFSGKGIAENIYSPINPVGNYGVYKVIQVLRKYISIIKEKTGKDYDEIRILDCGCGAGTTTRIISNLIGNTYNVYGFEFSKNRLEYCKSMNPAIHYLWGDITQAEGVFADLSDIPFDGIVASDVLSQLRMAKDVESALKNISNALSDHGVFLWYEINAKTHEENYEADTQGFSEHEMDEYAQKCGLRMIYKSRVNGSIKLFGKTFSTYYFVNDKLLNIKFMEMIDPLLLKFGHLNNVRMYMKL